MGKPHRTQQQITAIGDITAGTTHSQPEGRGQHWFWLVSDDE